MWKNVAMWLGMIGFCYVIAIISHSTGLLCDYLEEKGKTGFLYGICRIFALIFLVLTYLLFLPALILEINRALSKPAQLEVARKARDYYEPMIQKLKDERDHERDTKDFYAELLDDRKNEIESLKADISALNIAQDEALYEDL